MKSVNFKSITIQNFLSIGKPITIPFTSGINIITGKNKDKDDENGVGKSTICDAFFFAIFGETIRKLNKERIVNNIAKKNCKVELTFEIDKNGTITKYRIERGLAPSFCTIYINDNEDKTLATIPITNLYIINLINTTQNIFKNTITMSGNKSIPFMSQKKNEKREFIEGIFRLEIVKAMSKIAKDNYDIIFKEFESDNRLFQELDANIKNYEIRKTDHTLQTQKVIAELEKKILDNTNNINTIKSKLIPVDITQLDAIELQIAGYNRELVTVDKKYNDLMVNLGTLKGRQSTNQQQIVKGQQAITSAKDELNNLIAISIEEKTIEVLNEEIQTLSENINTLKDKNFNLNRDILDLFTQNSQLSDIGDVCKTCKRPFPNQDVTLNEQKQQENHNNILSFKNDIKTNLNLIKDHTDCVAKYTQNIKVLENKKNVSTKITEYTKQLLQLEDDNVTIVTDLESLDKCMVELQGYQQRWKPLLQECQDKKTALKMLIQTYNYGCDTIKIYEKEIEDNKKAIVVQNNLKNPFEDLILEGKIKLDNILININKLKEKIAIYDVIKYAVSDTGFKAHMIKKMLKALNERLNYYLRIMDSNCKLSFDEFFVDTILDDRGTECEYDQFSGGEQKRIDLACLFAFMDIRRILGDVSFNIAFYDELLDSALSATCSIKLFDILKERLDKYNETSYIITHRKENLKNPKIDNVIYFEKSSGITTMKKYNEEIKE